MAKGRIKRCISCDKDLAIASNFYSTNNPMFADGKVPLCKKCIREQVKEDDLDSVRRVLRQVDKPFIYSLWQKSVESQKDTFGTYIKNINSLPQYRDMTYDDSVDEFGDKGSAKHNYNTESKSEADSIEDIKELDTGDGDKVTISKEIKAKFGGGFTNREYLEMEKFFKDMETANEIKDAQHRKLLIRLCQLNIFIDRSLDDPSAFDKYQNNYEKIMKSAGFRPADRVSGSESTGIRTFSQVWEEVEKDGFIEPPDLKFSQDIIDRSIMYIENNHRSLLNVEKLPEPPADTPKVDEGG